jgi:hypothetical protein
LFYFDILEMDTPENWQSRQTQKFSNLPTARREMHSQNAFQFISIASHPLASAF